MYNTYLSSTIGFRSKGSLCFSVNDYYFGSGRCETIPYSSSCTCSCCAFSIHGRVPMNMNPRFCYGLRQSTLIQCSASRRLLLGGGDRYCRFSSNDIDIDRVCCRDSYSIEESSRRKERERGRRGRRFGCVVWEERFERCNSSMDENVDAMLSLLTEDISENLVSVRQRRNKIGTGGGRAESRRRGVSECSKEENKYVVSGSLGNSSRGKYETSTIKSSEEACCGRKIGSSLRSENSGSRKGGSSGSSYYSALSSDDIDVSDMDIQVDDIRYAGESLSNCRNKQSIKNDKNLSVGDVRKQHKKYEDVKQYEEVKMHRNKDIVEIGIDWDSRNKAEKLDLVSGGQIGTRKESSVQGIYEVSAEGTSSSQRLYNSSRENGSASSTKYVQEAREQRGQKGHEVIQQSESRRETNKVSEVSDIQESDIYRESIEKYRASSSEKRFSGREAEQTAGLNLVQEARNRKNQTSLQITEQNESARKFEQRKEMSLDLQSRNNVLQVHDSHLNKASTSHEISETRTKNRKEESASFMSSIQETEQRRTQAAQQDDMMKNQESTYISTFDAKDNTSITSSHGSDVQRCSNSKRSETRMKNKEEDSTILMSSVQERKHQNTQTDQQIDWMIESRKENDDFINTSVMGDINSVGFTSTQKLTETKNSPEIPSTSPVDLGPGGRKRHGKTGEQLIRKVLSRNESERISKSSSFGRNSTERVSSFQTPTNLDHQSEMQQSDIRKKDKGNSQAMVTPPTPQLVLRVSPKSVPSQRASKGYSTQKDPLETSGSSSSAMYIHSQTAVPVLRNDLDSGTSNSEMHSELIVNEDALVSANQLEESSTMFVGEFMERLRHEVSASEVLEGRTSSQTTSTHKDANIMPQSTNPQASENLQSQVVGSMISSSRTTGPSDEIWDVAAPSSLEPLKRITPGEASSSGGGVIAKSSNRSLWSVVSDIVRLRWSAGSETHKSSVKSGGRSSSNESENSEAWFSGHEPDDKNDEHARKGRRGMPKKSRSADQLSQKKSSEQSQQDANEGMGFHEETIQVGTATSSSSNTAERSPASKGASTASKEETSGRKEDERVRGAPFVASTDDSPLPSHTRRLIRSPPVEHSKVESNSEVPKSSSAEIVEHPITERPAEGSGVDDKEGQLKRRKLQRNNQVLSERFEEWEEAYLIESEQRKIDEMFMREALLEAKKAADTWEVPVGAVLVQHGKIIARGCNLVEELRDSTAHAEMICIREASNVLRTWRLSETTLYVTLEPCPMCAGAILQARVDNVVWGAPNKLLGADGSWVRLFPGGGEGTSDSDPTNQSTGPVHPFHPKITIRRGILATECADAMQQFFQLRRRTKEKKKSESPPPSCLPISTQPKFLSKMHNIFSVMFCL